MSSINKRQLGYHDGFNAFPVQTSIAISAVDVPGCPESGPEYIQGLEEGKRARQQNQFQQESRQHILA